MKANSRSKSKKRQSQSQRKIKSEEDFFDNIMNININKPGNPYNFYIREQMTKNKIPSLIEASKTYGPKWANISDKEKEKFEKLSTDDKARYDENLKLVKKYLFDPDMLKEQVSPYMAFKRAYVDNAINEQDREPAEARKAALGAWDDLSKEEKMQWEKEFDKKKDLLDELKDFKPGLVNAYSMFIRDKVGNSDVTFKQAAEAWGKVSEKQRENYEKYAAEENKERRKKLGLWEIMSGIKPRRPVGALTFYIRELSKQNKLEGVKNVFSFAAPKFKELSESEREKYEKMHKQEQLEYAIKLAEYKKFITSRFGRAPTAFNLYVKDKSADYEDEELEAGDLFKLLSEKWKKESDSVKNKYEERAKVGKEEYDNYKKENTNIIAPKRPSTGYGLYLTKNYASYKQKNPKAASSEIFKMIGEKWKSLKEKEKEPYEDMAKKDKERYQKEIEEFEKEHGVRGRTKSTQRYVDDKRLLSSKESGYSKYRSQQEYNSRSQSKARSKSRNSKSKSKAKDKDNSSKNKSKNRASKASDRKDKSKAKDKSKTKDKSKAKDKDNKKDGKKEGRSRSNSVSSKVSKGKKK